MENVLITVMALLCAILAMGCVFLAIKLYYELQEFFRKTNRKHIAKD